VPPSVAQNDFSPSNTAVRVNMLWIMSLSLSLCCALTATLIQQWSRRYLASVQIRGPPRKRGPLHNVLFAGIERFQMGSIVDMIIMLVHTSVILFMAGLLEFAFQANSTVAYALLAALVSAGLLYGALTLLPIISADCPYSTPLTRVTVILSKTFLRLLRFAATFADEWIAQSRWYFTINNFFVLKIEYFNREPVVSIDPEQVLVEMCKSLDQQDEIYELCLSLPAFLIEISKEQFYERGGTDMEMFPFLFRTGFLHLLGHHVSTSYVGLTLNPLPNRQDIGRLVRLALLTNRLLAASHRQTDLVDHFHIGERGTSAHLLCDRPESSWWTPNHWVLVAGHSRMPAARFTAFCVLSSLFIISRPMTTLRDPCLFDLDPPTEWCFFSASSVLHSDVHGAAGPLFLGLCDSSQPGRAPGDFSDLYRLLLLIRCVLHFAAVPENPVAVVPPGLWLSVLRGLRDRCAALKLGRLPAVAREDIYELVESVGRGDLVPSRARQNSDTTVHDVYAPARDSSKLDSVPTLSYADIFEDYPELDETLRFVISATMVLDEGPVPSSAISEVLR
jgi:hypothetical protein